MVWIGSKNSHEYVYHHQRVNKYCKICFRMPPPIHYQRIPAGSGWNEAYILDSFVQTVGTFIYCQHIFAMV